MRVRLPALLLAALLLAACGSSVALYVRRQKNVDGAWDASHKGRVSKLDATGDVATLVFMERTFVFHGFEEFHGVVASDKVHLKAGKAEVFLDENGFRARDPGGQVRQPLSEIPEGRRFHYGGGRYWLE